MNLPKEAFVTGASRGLGRGFVEVLLERGYRVFAGMRSPEDFTLIHPNVVPVRLDLGNAESIEEALDTVCSKAQGLSLIINNGAIQRNSPEIGGPEKVCALDQLTRDVILKMFEINAVAPLIVLKGLLPLLRSDPSYCINISSARGVLYTDETLNSSGNYGYRSSKAALSVLTMATTFDLPKHVRTFSVHPGLVKTDMNPTGNITPQQSAEKILSILDIWKPSLNGAFLRNDGVRWQLDE